MVLMGMGKAEHREAETPFLNGAVDWSATGGVEKSRVSCLGVPDEKGMRGHSFAGLRNLGDATPPAEVHRRGHVSVLGNGNEAVGMKVHCRRYPSQRGVVGFES